MQSGLVRAAGKTVSMQGNPAAAHQASTWRQWKETTPFCPRELDQYRFQTSSDPFSAKNPNLF